MYVYSLREAAGVFLAGICFGMGWLIVNGIARWVAGLLASGSTG